MDILIRRAKESDLSIIQAFGAKLLNFEKTNFDPALDANWCFTKEAEEKYLAAIKEKYTIIAEYDGAPIGFLIGKIIKPSAESARSIKQAYLENIFVDEKMRGKKIGENLIRNFEEYCKENGVNRLNVSVLTDNTGAVKFYENVNFKSRSINLYKEL